MANVKDVDRREYWGTAPPSSGRHGVGDRVWNSSPTDGAVMGWVCTSPGTPGTWLSFGRIGPDAPPEAVPVTVRLILTEEPSP